MQYPYSEFLCRDTDSIVLDYLVGDKQYLQDLKRKMLKELFFRLRIKEKFKEDVCCQNCFHHAYRHYDECYISSNIIKKVVVTDLNYVIPTPKNVQNWKQIVLKRMLCKSCANCRICRNNARDIIYKHCNGSIDRDVIRKYLFNYCPHINH
jgi:hypothetical protein